MFQLITPNYAWQRAAPANLRDLGSFVPGPQTQEWSDQHSNPVRELLNETPAFWSGAIVQKNTLLIYRKTTETL